MEEYQNMEEYLSILINEYGDSVLRMCYIYLRDYQLAEDVAQETFIRVYQNYGRFRNQSSVQTWILKIAINLCKNQMRTHWWRYRSEKELLEVDTTGYYDGLVDRQTVLSEIGKLPIKYKEVILLYYYQQLTILEIAGLLNEKESTVKSRLVRARKKLKTKMEKEFGHM